MSHQIAGYAAAALASLTPTQVAFLHRLPKAELHAHLNGSIPLATLQALAAEYAGAGAHTVAPDAVRAGVAQLQAGVSLDAIHDFFGLFPAIYALTSTPTALGRAARAVLEHFLEPVHAPGQEGADGEAHPEAAYLELRSTPRATPAMSRRAYVETVLAEVERYPSERAALIVSLDRKMDRAAATECIEVAVSLRKEGRRVVGIDLCGDPTAGDMSEFEQYFKTAKDAGLSVTLHIAEITTCPSEETLQLLSYKPNRLGHATFLNEAAKKIVHTEEMCIEICLSSNLLCHTVPSLDSHHLRYYLGHDHPVAICTDDILPFRNSLLGEYALLMAEAPLGLGLTEAEIEKLAKMSMDSRFH